jgi:hypothetical protein
MLGVRAVLMGVVLGLPALAMTPAHAQPNQFANDVLHFFDGMTPNGSMRQAYEAGRHDERAALLSRRDQWCSPQQPYATQPYGYGPYANR